MTPYWRYAPALDRHEVDVVVVGAGVCGLSAALELRDRGFRVAVLERDRIGSGASGRNAGFLMRGMADNYAAAFGQHGRERARRLWRWTEENLAILRSRGVESLDSYRRAPSCLLALPGEAFEQEHAELRASEALLREDGFEVRWLDRHDDDAWRAADAPGGLLNPGDAQVNPRELVLLLAASLTGAIHEHAPVIGFTSEAGGEGVVVRTESSEFHAARALVCTNAYGALLLGSLAGRVLPNRAQMLAIRPDGAYRMDFSYYINRGHEYARQTPDGVVVVGGRRLADERGERGYDGEPGGIVQQELERFARDTLGLRGPVVARWAGTMGFSPDGLPIIGPVEVDGMGAGLVWFCGGFTGHGMSLAARCAREAVALMLEGGRVARPAQTTER
jgi:glycine/D-amino acid oxidase-like deaminating enzyme